jgi:UDP-glucose:(heptosyl)LPS alpha-1,3-glucosyltransferase
MRIALIQPKFDSHGGAERYALNLGISLSRHGHEVHLFGRRAKGLQGKVRFHRLWSIPIGRALKTWSFDRIARLYVAGNDFPIIQGSGKTTCQNIHRLGGGLHRAYLQQIGKQADSWYDRLVLAMEDRLMQSSSLKAIICPSCWVREELESYYPKLAAIAHVIANGVDLNSFSYCPDPCSRKDLRAAFAATGSRRVLLFVAANFWLKGLDRAIALLPYLPESVLIVIGGDKHPPFIYQARTLGVADRLVFLGPQADMPAYYQAADLLIHPTRYDPFANVCLEALSCGTPVITTARDGVADLLRAGQGGAVMDPKAGPEHSARLVESQLNQGLAARQQARQLACEYSQGHHLARIETLYYRIADRADPLHSAKDALTQP